MNLLIFTFTILIICLNQIKLVKCSPGDRLQYYSDCLQYCFYLNCSTNSALNEFNSKQASLLKLMGWNCEEECNYNCQWLTIDYLVNQRNIKRLPQFHGKWTFKRYLGLQEPASAIFSLMNLVVYFLSWNYYNRNVIRIIFKENHKYSLFKLKEFYRICSLDKEFILITLNSISALNAWLWSTVFHCKDFRFTEKMDYFSAFLFVITGFALSLIKLLNELNLRKSYFQSSILILILSFGIYHEKYLLFDKLDYQYNMKVNIILGICSTLFWIYWCFIRFKKYRTKYLAKCIMGLLLMNLFLAFEIFDFPPILYIFDAHSLWHASTIFLHILWFSFLMDEFKFKTQITKGYLNLQNN